MISVSFVLIFRLMCVAVEGFVVPYCVERCVCVFVCEWALFCGLFRLKRVCWLFGEMSASVVVCGDWEGGWKLGRMNPLS